MAEELLLEKNPAIEAEPEIEIEEVDDRPEADRRPPRVGNPAPDPTEEELASATPGLQKRLKQLTYERHEERRAKEQELREKIALIQYTNALTQQIETERQHGVKMHQAAIKNAVEMKDAEIEALKRSYRDALIAGDPDKASDDQVKIAKLAAERNSTYLTPPLVYPTIQAPQAPPPPQQKSDSPEEAIKWAQENTWFFSDDPVHQAMAQFARAKEMELTRSGSNVYTKDHYQRIDQALREQFPGKFSDSPQKSAPRNTQVAPSSRSIAGPEMAPRKLKVQLTPSEISICNQLGISKEGYAKQKAQKMQQESA